MVRGRFRRLFVLAALLAVLVALVPIILIVRSAQASGAAITLSPTSGAAGATVQVSGGGFRHRETVNVTFDAALVATATTTTTGAFSATFAAPQAAQAGSHTVTATGAKSGLIASAIFTVISGADNWPQFGYGAPGGRFNPLETTLSATNASQLTLDWAAPVGGNPTSFAVYNGVVYVVDGTGVDAFNTATGVKLWFSSTMGTGSTESSGGGPAVDSGMVFANGGDNHVYAFNAQTGATLWTFAAGSNMNSSPAVANGVVYITDRNGFIYALNETSGALAWSYQVANGDSLGQTAAVANGVVYFVSIDGVAYALNATTGALVWSVAIGTPGPNVMAPVVDNGVVYVTAGAPYPSTQGEIAALDAMTGAIKWTAFTAFYGMDGLALANGTIYVSVISTGVYAFDEATGALKWQDNIAMGESAPAAANGVVFVGAGTAYVYALDASTGATLASVGNCGTQPYTSPVVAQGVVYSGCASSISAFHLPGTTP